jgi:hypothetical protein
MHLLAEVRNLQNADKPPPAEKKTKQKKGHEAKDKSTVTSEFPVDARINAYGFMFLKTKWLGALGWHGDMRVKIERNADGSITVRRA